MEIISNPHELASIEQREQRTLQSMHVDADMLIICDDESRTQAVRMTSQIRDMLKQLETERTSITKPINEGLKAINARFKKMEAAASEIKGILDRKILDDKIKRDLEAMRLAAEAEAQRKAEEAANVSAAQNDEQLAAALFSEEPPETIAVPTKTVARVDDKTVSTVKRWTFEVLDEKNSSR